MSQIFLFDQKDAPLVIIIYEFIDVIPPEWNKIAVGFVFMCIT